MRMQKWRNILLCAAVSFMFLFMAVGYAQLTDSLAINGTAKAKEIETIYITAINVTGSSNVTVNDSNGIVLTKNGYLVFSHNDYQLNKQGSWWEGNTPGVSITITVTVKNNSGADQYFGYLTAVSDSDLTQLQNTVITYSQSGDSRLVKHGETQTFTFTIQNISRSPISMNNFESLLVFSPILSL